MGKQRCSLQCPCDSSDATWKEVTLTSSLHLVIGLKICNNYRLSAARQVGSAYKIKQRFSRKHTTTSRHLCFLYIRNDLFSVCRVRCPWNWAKINKWAIVTNWCHRNTPMADTQRRHYRGSVYVIIGDSEPHAVTRFHRSTNAKLQVIVKKEF